MVKQQLALPDLVDHNTQYGLCANVYGQHDATKRQSQLVLEL